MRVFVVFILSCLCNPISPAFAVKTSSERLDKVVLQLSWYHEFQFAGYYAAQLKGYYAEEGLQVDIRQRNPEKQPADLVMSGEADFGTATSDIMLLRMQGEPVVVLACIMQHSPWCLLTLEDSDIIVLEDLIGKTVGMDMSYRAVEILAMLRDEHISTEDMTLVPKKNTLDNLLNGTVDARASYISDQPFILQEKGIPYRVIRPISYGIDFYGDTLFTSDSQIKNHPERVAAFRRASLRGWQYAMDHPEELIDFIVSTYYADPSKTSISYSPEHLRYEADVMAEELMNPLLIEIGQMNPKRWRRIADTYAKMGLAKPIDSLEDFLYSPNPEKDYQWVYALYASVASIVLVSTVAHFWSQRLRRAVALRTRELRESNEQVRLLLDSTEEAIYGLDMDGNCTWSNSACIKMLGYDSFEQLLGKNMHKLIHHTRPDGSHYPTKECLIYMSFQSGVPSHVDNEVLWRADGSSFPAEYWAHPVERDGKIVGLVVTFMDITARIQAQTEQQLLERQLQHTQKLESLGVLAGGIAHDFNNILAGILGYAELALDELSDSHPSISSIKEVIVGANRAAELTRQMLDYSGKGDFILESLNVSEIAQDMIQLIRTSIPRTIELTIDLDFSLPSVYGDSAQIQQVVMNLITNAADAIGEEHGTITFSTSRLWCDEGHLANNLAKTPDGLILPSGYYIYFKVSDTGCGMDEETKSKIFDPFFSTKFTGRGLGMAAVLGIILGHKGVITLDTEPGKGSTFHVFFPEIKNNITTKKAAIEIDSNPAPLQSALTVLLVDDEASVRDVIQSILQNQGYTVLTAEHGAGAITVFNESSENIDVVFLDLTMPQMDGIECLKVLRNIKPDVKVVIMSGFSEQDALERLTLEANTGFIQKPFKRDAMLDILRKVLEL